MSWSTSASFDPDEQPPCLLNTRLEYHWKFLAKPPGSMAELNDPDILNPSFVTDRPGEYVIELSVTDSVFAAFARLSITANPAVVLNTAPGFMVDFVAGQDTYFDRPEGVSIAGDGAIYVVQQGNDTITRSQGGVTVKFSDGGWLQIPHDIDWYPPSEKFFVTSDGVDALVELDQNGDQTLWSRPGQVQQPVSIAYFVNAAGQGRLAATERANDRIDFFDPTDNPLAFPIGTEDFGGNLSFAWGVDAAVIGDTNIYYCTDSQNDELWRTNGTTDRMLADYLNEPRDVERASSGALLVADSASGMLLLIDDCINPPCPVEVVAWGPWEPWGLEFESTTELLVTDRAGDNLFRVTGRF